MKKSESIKEIATALSKVQGASTIALKNAKGYNYKFADYQTVWNCVKGPLVENGLSVAQDAVSCPDGVYVITTVMHKSGEWLEFGPLLVPMAKKDAHSTGSAITYARRYALSAALHIVADDDDDGALAMKAGAVETKPKPPQVKPLTTEELAAWIDESSADFDRQDIENYLMARSAHLGHTVNISAAELKANKVLFEKNITIWIDQQEATN